MFLLDNILFSPVKGIYAVLRELHEAAQQEHANQAESIRNQLSDLYMQLETGQITETEFDQEERGLLDRLELLEGAEGLEEGEEVSEDEADEEEMDEDADVEMADEGEEDEEEAATTETVEVGP